MTKRKRPLILVTNDDGIFAPGIRTLIEEARKLGDVLVVAPHEPQSGMGHAITVNNFLRLHEVKYEGVDRAFSCSGTPVDCVKLAIYKVLEGKKPDLLVSGINHGSNKSINVLYSGTMSAAVEGALEGIPSIGFSLEDHSLAANMDHCRGAVRTITSNALKDGMPHGTCLNVNIPNAELGELKGVKVCRQAKANWEDDFETRLDPSGKEYYWMRGSFKDRDKGEDTDVWALRNGYVSVVPVQYDVTAHHDIVTFNQWDYELG